MKGRFVVPRLSSTVSFVIHFTYEAYLKLHMQLLHELALIGIYVSVSFCFSFLFLSNCHHLVFICLLPQLYNVITDTEVTGQKILKNGKLARRVTIIPLNQIAGRSIDNRTVQQAEALVGVEGASVVEVLY